MLELLCCKLLGTLDGLTEIAVMAAGLEVVEVGLVGVGFALEGDAAVG